MSLLNPGVGDLGVQTVNNNILYNFLTILNYSTDLRMRTILLKCPDVEDLCSEECTWCRCLSVQLLWSCRLSSGWQSPRQRPWAAVPCTTKAQGPVASQVRDTQRWGRNWGAQTFTYLDCKGIKPQGFLCSGSSSEAPARAVIQLMHHD